MHVMFGSVSACKSCVYPLQAPELIKKFDEQSVAKTHKFGVIYQSFGQVSSPEHALYCSCQSLQIVHYSTVRWIRVYERRLAYIRKMIG